MTPSLLREAEFRRFWLGQTVSVFGDQVTLLVLPIIAVLTLNADAVQMGYLTAGGLLPNLVFSLPAGVWLDRVRRRRWLMIRIDVCRAALIASLPIAYLLGVLSLAQLFVVGFVCGSMAVVFDLSWSSLFVSVTRRDQYVSANSLLSGSRSLSNVGGPPIGGMLIQLLGAPLALAADAASFLGSAFFLSRIQSPEPAIKLEEGGLRASLIVGAGFAARDPIMRPVLVAAATVNLFQSAFSALFILYATRSLGISPGVLGLVLGSGAVGGLLGAVVAAPIGRRLGLGPAYALGLILFPASLTLVPAVTEPYSAVLAALFASAFSAGLGVMILDINVGSIVLARTPHRIRNRAGGAYRFINHGIRPIGALVGGLLGSAVGIRPTLVIVTLAATSGVLWLIGTPVLQLRDLPDPPD